MKWAQYYTAHPYAELLVRRMEPLVQQAGGKLMGVELGAGRGALLASALRQWRQANFNGIDICAESIARVKAKFPEVMLQQMDLLDSSIWSQHSLTHMLESQDIAFCNPPFQAYSNNADFRSLCSQANMRECARLPRSNAALVFLLHNIRLLKTGGVIGIILPDGLLTGREYEAFRADLLTLHRLEAIIQLPDHAFAGIEARTHILLVRKGLPALDRVPLYQSSSSGELSTALYVSANKLLQRMDHSYWLHNSAQSKPCLSLADIGVEIHRGSRSKKLLRAQGLSYVHSSDMPGQPIPVKCRFEENNTNHIRARSNDILVVRVGKRCIGRVALVTSGDVPISDCLFRVRVPSSWLERVWAALSSNQAQDWFTAQAHGTCAQSINKTDLLSFPIGCSP